MNRMKLLTVKDEQLSKIRNFTREYFDVLPTISQFDSDLDMLQFAQETGKKFVILILADDEPSEPKEAKQKGRKTGTYKEPDKPQSAALKRALEKGENRKKVLSRTVDMSLNTFNVFLSRNPHIETVREANQEKNRLKSKEKLKTELVDGLQQITMKI